MKPSWYIEIMRKRTISWPRIKNKCNRMRHQFFDIIISLNSIIWETLKNDIRIFIFWMFRIKFFEFCSYQLGYTYFQHSNDVFSYFTVKGIPGHEVSVHLSFSVIPKRLLGSQLSKTFEMSQVYSKLNWWIAKVSIKICIILKCTFPCSCPCAILKIIMTRPGLGP